MGRPFVRVARLSEWHRIKGSHPSGMVVEAVAVRRVGFGALCEVGKGRVPARLRSKENSWNPAEQKSDAIELGVSFGAVVMGYDDDWRELILSRKAVEHGTFDNFVASNPVGTVVDGTVERAESSRYVLRLEGNIEALLEKSALPQVPEAASSAVAGIADVFVGDRIRAMITHIDGTLRKIHVDVVAFLRQRVEEVKREVEALRRRPSTAPPTFSTVANGGIPGVQSDGRTHQKLSILLVEDRSTVLSPVQWALQRRGHRVTAGDDAGRAIERLQRTQEIDVALVDLQLVGDSGEAVCREVRQRFPHARIYAFTGNPDALTADMATPGNGHLDGIILKPVDAAMLTDYVEGRSRPPAMQRTWALDQVLESFVGQERLGVKEPDCARQNNLLDSHLSEIDKAIPGARAAVLSLRKETAQIACLRTYNCQSNPFARLSARLAFSPVGDVLRDGIASMRYVHPLANSENPSLRELMLQLESRVLVGLPLHVESRRDPLALFVFLPENATCFEKEWMDRCEGVAANLTVAIERSLLDVELVRHQRAICVGSLMLGMTHELRNSLQSLESYTCMLELSLRVGGRSPGPGVPSGTELLSQVHNQVRSLKQNLEMFLGVVRVEQTGRQRLDEVLTEVVESCRTAATQDDIFVDLVVPDVDNLPHVPRIMRQAFLNLLLNAIQHTAATRWRGNLVRIALRNAAVEEGHGWVEIRFIDNAWGIHAGDRERIFEMFYTTRKHGSGLGLYVTRLIIEGLGGEISVEETTKFAGTTFLVRFPVSVQPEMNHNE